MYAVDLADLMSSTLAMSRFVDRDDACSQAVARRPDALMQNAQKVRTILPVLIMPICAQLDALELSRGPWHNWSGTGDSDGDARDTLLLGAM